jgi:hypothetical protein
MHVLAAGSAAPEFHAQSLGGEELRLSSTLLGGPLLLVFAMPHVFASRLVVGYLRRLKAQVPKAPVWLVLQGDEEAVTSYARGYLDGLSVIHDRDLFISHIYEVTHVPSCYLLREGKVARAFTGFLREGLNHMARELAEAYGAKPQVLIGVNDNKGEYELAEVALSARR